MRRPLWTIILYILLTVVSCINVLPIIWLFLTSLKDPLDIFDPQVSYLPAHPTLDNYAQLLGDLFPGSSQQSTAVNAVYLFPLGDYFRNSLIIGCGTALCAMILGSLAAYSLARLPLPFREQIFYGLLLVRMVPPFALIIPLYLLMLHLHLLDTWWSVITAQTAIEIPFVIWLMRGFFAEIPREIGEAAHLDGCSELLVLVRVVLPLARPGLAATSVFCFLISYIDFLFPLTLTSTQNAATLPVGLALLLGQNTNAWNILSAAGIIALLPGAILFILAQRHLVAGLTFGAVRT